MKQTLELEILSPVHIGSGRSPLVADIDFVRGRQIYIIDQDRLFAALPTDKLNHAAEGATLSKLLGGVSEYPKYARYGLNLPDAERVPQILEFIKTGPCEPYIPGSSLKGAIRTALAWAMLKDGALQIDQRDIGYNPRFADDPLLARLFGSDPNHDLLRALQVSDTAGVTANGHLELARVQLYNLMGQGKQTTFRPKAGFEFFIEALRSGSKLYGEARLDDFLLNEPQAQRLGFGWRIPYLRDWLRHCNRFAQMLIEHERQFFAQQGLRELVTFYDGLARTAAQLDETRECLLQISWGTGWTAKTVGTALPAELVQYARAEFRLGRSGQVIFPKTRRLTIRGQRVEAPLGWVKATAR